MEQKAKEKKWWQGDISIGGVSSTDILLFTKHLSVGLKAGLTIVDALDMLCEQATGAMRKMLLKIKDTVSSGKPFYEALAAHEKYFSPLYISMIKTGEITGNLEDNLAHLADNLWKNHELKQKIKSAMMYPIIVFVAIVGLGFAISIFVLPKILPLFKSMNVELPLATRVMLFVANLFAEHGLSISVGFIVFVIFIAWLLRQNFVKPVTHRILLVMPIVSTIIKNLNIARFTSTLATLLSSGMTVDTSLQIIVDSTQNRMYKGAIQSLIAEVQKGKRMASVLIFYPALFPSLTSRMIAMGEQTGSLEKTLKYLSQFYEEEIDSTMRNLGNILEPILLMVIGVIVGTVAIAILGPIYQITGSLRK